MPDVDVLITKIERARRFASAMTDEIDRSRFEALAAELQCELDSIRDPLGSERASSEN